ncbi:hypothetical protein A2631_03085 [Candidatus Daviesbacteria bacterium RIFCSPHIGHO2_01_FULL_44_29]|uniref:SCP domain-containing protein n=1 Tax=Candidatus Daviesbacteria bacterium RIFCSPHIGHO2_02_FULL_43_12 TaxID=1797776 RepID=A0A1F5KKA8_9BACT|nr:MAG: hypothetical protein A2631_03085 [Candidatus Daviesbacteria bacterium RIFCSPHIGHO2_01_FULL_44_29]OGE40780.1 MAG: hypothetical protein A3E86_02260 [Candidatus Daviesbacteria bacterium RIFCSPHIGHO2_12_FULL_47_45]OGE41368.1 MAG: hypothetical protein A3D25_02480 [Candidatus Daviesbacteria bacterium RIFCSPHIGHO2_02_FULL_43_12]OGE69569.1 MAG: hypothetical protein A3B55_04225 [Candidatus Daviesbacteria bacterium RIFCSPLOWO2_01_FULL_43_15]
MRIRNFFLPHPKTHQKAHLLSWKAILIYLLLFTSLRFGIGEYAKLQPGVLGVTSNIGQKEVISLTNAQRVAHGLSEVRENEMLDKAAEAKAKNMFAEDYWAHYSPSGKDPWGFIQRAGYKFLYAGENLARNFYTSDEVVDAWMASPSHRDNLLNAKYQEIGIAVVEGVLKGQKTTLVVQEFGTPVESLADATKTPATPPAAEKTISIDNDVLPARNASQSEADGPAEGIANGVPTFGFGTIDPFVTMKSVGLVVLGLLAFLLILDLIIIRTRAVFRVTSRHLPHLAMLGAAASALVSMHPGSIL